MPRYLKVLLDESNLLLIMENTRTPYRMWNYSREVQEVYSFHYHVINTISHLFIIKRIVNNKNELLNKLLAIGIIPLDVGNTKCNVPEKMYNVYFQSGSRIIVNNINKINKNI